MSDNNNIINRPYMNDYCDKCLYCVGADMDTCTAIKLGTSFVYCPAVIECNKFRAKRNMVEIKE